MSKKLYIQKRLFKKTPPKYSVRSEDKKELYGVIDSLNPNIFDGWEHCKDLYEKFEVKQLQQIFNGIQQHIQNADYDNLEDVRMKIPSNVMNAMAEINQLAEKNDLDFNFSQTMIAAVINMARTVTSRLPEEDKARATHLLENAGIEAVTRNKSFFNDHKPIIGEIFTELDSIYNKIERLQMIANRLFDKNKHYSADLITAFAEGSEHPNRWMIASAITVIAMEKNGSENLELLLKTPETFFDIWVNPLLHTAKKSNEEILTLYQEFFCFTKKFHAKIESLIKTNTNIITK